MAEQAEYPFIGYTLYKVFHSKEGRTMAQLVKSADDRTTMAYSRYLMSVKLKRKLSKEEEVDHIDDDKSNDEIGNLQILSKHDNIAKWAKTLTTEFVKFICPICGISFERFKRNSHRLSPACSRACGYEKTRLKLTGRGAVPKIVNDPGHLERNARAQALRLEGKLLRDAGATFSQIAAKLGISKTTAKRHQRELLKGVSTE